MMKKRRAKRERKRKDRPALSAEEQGQLQLLLDRLAIQDPAAEGFAQFVESLEPLVQRPVPFTIAFIEALGTTATPAAVKVLHILAENPLPKRVRRALKTALYRLARQGLVVKEETTESGPRVLVPRPPDRQAEAWAGWPESLGERGIVLKLPDAGRGYLLAVGVVNSEGVFQDFEVIQTTRKGVRSLLDEITGGVLGRLIEIPVAHLRFLYEEIVGSHKEQNRELPPAYEAIHKQLTHWAEPAPRPHIYHLLDGKEIDSDPLLLRSSDSLLDEQPFVAWRLADEAVAPFVEKINELSESRLVISQSAQLERLEQIIREAAAELFTPQMRQRYRRLLEEAALLLFLVDKPQEAKRVLAVALDLENEVGLLTENVFVLGLVRRSIAAKADLEPETGEGQAAAERRTESGLIIPR